jgi:hypothetical protein
MKEFALLFLIACVSACAAGHTSTPNATSVSLKGDMLIDPEYGYSLRIPTGFKMAGESNIASMSPESEKEYRASLVNPSDGSDMFILCGRSKSTTKQEAVKASRREVDSIVIASNKKRGSEFFFDLAHDRYQQLSDMNIAVDSLGGKRILIYTFFYDFRGSLHELALMFIAPLSNFDSCLPAFYSCVKFVNLPDQIPRSERQEQKEPASVRLERLNQLKDSGLISEQDYERKKADILNGL